MNNFSCRRPSERQFVVLTLLIFVAGVIGCGQQEGIRSYPVAKEAKPAATERMLAAIVPAGSQAWFFKVVGPLAAVDERANEIEKFFSTIRVSEDDRPRWELPESWKEEAGSQMRAATILIPADGKPLEMSVSALPWSGTDDDVLRNVNRWRTQMKLPEIGLGQLGESTRKIQAGDQKFTVSDLTGQFQGGPSMGPFAGGSLPGGSAPAGSTPQAGAGTDLPPGHPPIDAVGGAADRSAAGGGPAPDAPQFDAPASWEPLAVPPGGMRKAAFGVAEGEQQALVTIIAFATTEGQMIADPLMNVNRWRREVGLSEIEKEQLDSTVESVEINGQSGRYVKLIPDDSNTAESKAELGTLAAMVTSGDRIWFIKMIGSRELVASQEEEFKSFLQSFRFPDS